MKIFILDVDGVLTTGQFFYGEDGKLYKVFGPDDNDALNILKKYMRILFVTADKRGYAISKKRIVEHMGFDLNLVDQKNRKAWVENKYKLEDVIYMADGIYDYDLMKNCGYSIAPLNASIIAKNYADKITACEGGKRAVAEACLHILDKFFKVKFPF